MKFDALRELYRSLRGETNSDVIREKKAQITQTLRDMAQKHRDAETNWEKQVLDVVETMIEDPEFSHFVTELQKDLLKQPSEVSNNSDLDLSIRTRCEKFLVMARNLLPEETKQFPPDTMTAILAKASFSKNTEKATTFASFINDVRQLYGFPRIGKRTDVL